MLCLLDPFPYPFDGFLCNSTVFALDEFFNEFGPFNNVEPPPTLGLNTLSNDDHTRLIDPELLAALFRTACSFRSQVNRVETIFSFLSFYLPRSRYVYLTLFYFKSLF